MRVFLTLLAVMTLVMGACTPEPGTPEPTPTPVDIEITNLDDAGPGSFREALLSAAPGESIGFERGLEGTLVLTSGELELKQDVAIFGPGPDLIAISAANNSRVLYVEFGVVAALANLELTDGTAPDGGVVVNSGELTLSNVVVSNGTTTASVGRGGGIRNLGDKLTLDYVTVRGNAGYDGGAIANDGNEVVIRNSTIRNNSADGVGGAITNYAQGGGFIQIENSTITGNGAQIGGALVSSFPGGRITITGATIVNNFAMGSAGGIHLSDSNSLTIGSSIVADNGLDLDGSFGSVTSTGYNIIGDGSFSTLVDGVGGDQVGTSADPIDPLLGALGVYGGITETLPLKDGSPALDIIPAADCLAADQRGVERPAGDKCDVGAYELTLPN